MTRTFRLALAQINTTVGDIPGNTAKIIRYLDEAREAQAYLVAFPELAITGYPPEDLLFKTSFLRDNVAAMEQVIAASHGISVVIGYVQLGSDIYNAAAVGYDGQLIDTYQKMYLPNYGVFDEDRYFKVGNVCPVYTINGTSVGVNICEDIWYATGPAVVQRAAGAEVIVNINGSPFHAGKRDFREKMLATRAADNGLFVAYVNLVGGQDELVFDGGSFVLDAACRLRAQLPMFREALVLTEWHRGGGDGVWTCADAHLEPPEVGMEPVYGALTLGLRDYVNKNRFSGVILGLSGGIDSALTAAVATDALGASRVHCVMMPSPYTSQDSLEDAAETARLLGARLDEIGIEPAMGAFDEMLEPIFDALAPDTTEENIQARARMMTLMAISNKLGAMLLSTGNKSEVSVGYATLYGDMAGGFNVLKDVYKTTAYRLARWRNQALPKGALGPAGRVIPERVLTKAPSAELKPDQSDQDTLPPYEVLDEILECLIEAEMGVDEIAARGHDRDTVNRVWRMLEMSEYKRRQACPGVKITRRAFGRDRRYPITNAFKGPA